MPARTTYGAERESVVEPAAVQEERREENVVEVEPIIASLVSDFQVCSATIVGLDVAHVLINWVFETAIEGEDQACCLHDRTSIQVEENLGRAAVREEDRCDLPAASTKER